MWWANLLNKPNYIVILLIFILISEILKVNMRSASVLCINSSIRYYWSRNTITNPHHTNCFWQHICRLYVRGDLESVFAQSTMLQAFFLKARIRWDFDCHLTTRFSDLETRWEQCADFRMLARERLRFIDEPKPSQGKMLHCIFLSVWPAFTYWIF